MSADRERLLNDFAHMVAKEAVGRTELGFEFRNDSRLSDEEREAFEAIGYASAAIALEQLFKAGLFHQVLADRLPRSVLL